MAEMAAATDGAGRRPVVRNGYRQPRTVVTAAGPVEVKAPRVNERRIDEATDLGPCRRPLRQRRPAEPREDAAA
ncbi:hypothetical protein ACFV2X_49000 [Streptomyces sp. NPDC059679]|uniref:hypothetical protein n=1 Tax=Streptomyces sp. NPDC059679 TaxID=3346903 RepID=UPI0036A9B964